MEILLANWGGYTGWKQHIKFKFNLDFKIKFIFCQLLKIQPVAPNALREVVAGTVVVGVPEPNLLQPLLPPLLML